MLWLNLCRFNAAAAMTASVAAVCFDDLPEFELELEQVVIVGQLKSDMSQIPITAL